MTILFRSVWVADWLYDSLPRAAVAAGLFGSMAATGAATLALGVALVMYGFFILLLRGRI